MFVKFQVLTVILLKHQDSLSRNNISLILNPVHQHGPNSYFGSLGTAEVDAVTVKMGFGVDLSYVEDILLFSEQFSQIMVINLEMLRIKLRKTA